MKLIFLGTGTSTGIPMIGCHCEVCMSKDIKDNRTRTSVYIEADGVKLVIDTGPDFRQQLLREEIEDIDAIVYTHPHKDHISGLDEIRPINHLRHKVIDVFANQITIDRLKREYEYIFDNNYPGVPQINLHLIEENKFKIRDLKIEIIHALHGKMPVLGFLIHQLAYVTDINYMSETEMNKIKGIGYLVINALHHQAHYSHFNLEQALEFIEQIKPKRTFLIHMSHKMGLHAQIAKTLPPNVFLSYDGLQLDI
jgi:phosphoribosyl 1,2-cyclic phosphate phosphodiesterase